MTDPAPEPADPLAEIKAIRLLHLPREELSLAMGNVLGYRFGSPSDPPTLGHLAACSETQLEQILQKDVAMRGNYGVTVEAVKALLARYGLHLS